MQLDEQRRRRNRWRNRTQTALLLGGMVAVSGGLAALLFGPVGAVWTTLLGIGAVTRRPATPAARVLSMYGARPLSVQHAPGLHRVIRLLSDRAGLPNLPTVHYVPSSMMNAFAVGRRDDAALALTDGLLRGLNDRELVGVLAHEIAHVRGDDLRVMSLSDTLARISHALSYAGMFLLLLTVPVAVQGSIRWPSFALLLTAAPTLVTLLQLALSRAREYDADLEAATLTGDPHGLASALQQLERAEGRIWERTMVPHRRAPDLLLWRTHPPTEERVRRLRELDPAGLAHPPITVPDVAGPRRRPPPRPVRFRWPGIRW